MTNPTETKQQYEGAILQQLIKNSERLAVVENDISNIKHEVSEIKTKLVSIETTNQKIESLLGWLKWIGGGVIAIALSLIANVIYSFFH